MNDTFERKVRAAAVAGWWVVLISVAFIVLQWLVYLAIINARPAWFLSMWGPNLDWGFVQMVWFWAIAIMKFIMWLMVLIALWLTLWARQLRKGPDGRYRILPNCSSAPAPVIRQTSTRWRRSLASRPSSTCRRTRISLPGVSIGTRWKERTAGVASSFVVFRCRISTPRNSGRNFRPACKPWMDCCGPGTPSTCIVVPGRTVRRVRSWPTFTGFGGWGLMRRWST